MANDNVTLQTIRIDVDAASANIKKLNNDLKTALNDNNKSLNDSSKSFRQNETQIKSWGESAAAQLKKYGEASLASIKLGAQAMTLDLGRSAIKSAAGEAVNMAFSFSKAFAEIKSRSNASSQDLEKWRNSLMQISVDTTANMDSMAESFKDLFSSVKNPDELLKIMGSIGDAAAMGDGDATKVSGFVSSTLKGQGREINKTNVDDVLSGTDLLRRKGNGFSDFNDAQKAMGSVSGLDMKKSGLSERDLASMMAGATNAGMEKEAAVKGIAEIIAMSNDPTKKGAVLAGVTGNRDLHTNGKLDLSKIANGNTFKQLMHYGNGDENSASSNFAEISGMSKEASDALFTMSKNAAAVNSAFKDAEEDTKTFGQSASEAKDNLQNAYRGFDQSLIKGVSDIFGGFEKPMKDLLQGKVGSAAGGLASAGDQALKGVGAHPALALGAVATLFAGGALLKGVLGKIPGLGMAQGAAQGQVAKAMGAEPVYVINAQEIGDDVGGSTGRIMSPFGAAIRGIGSGIGQAGLAAGIGIAVGEVINGYLESHQTENAAGQKYTSVEKGIAKVIPEFLGGMTKSQYNDTYNNDKVIQVELKSKDKHYDIVPSAGHLPRDGRTK